MLSKDDAELFQRFIEDYLDEDLELLQAYDQNQIKMLIEAKLRAA